MSEQTMRDKAMQLKRAMFEARDERDQAKAKLAAIRELADVSGWHVYESRDTGDVYPAGSVQDRMADIRRAIEGGDSDDA